MRIQVYFIILIIFSVCSLKSSIAEGQEKSYFPESWEGKWKGKLKILSKGELKDEIEMELHILPLDTPNIWQWKIIYSKNNNPQPRDYELHVVDKNKGLYKIDEKNSIIIECSYINNALFSSFEVGKILLFTSVKMNDGKLEYNIWSSNKAKADTTGGKDDIPKVICYPLNSQYSILERFN